MVVARTRVFQFWSQLPLSGGVRRIGHEHDPRAGAARITAGERDRADLESMLGEPLCSPAWRHVRPRHTGPAVAGTTCRSVRPRQPGAESSFRVTFGSARAVRAA